MQVVWGARTDRGRVRAVNEDAFLSEPPVFLVADGMGGYESGGAASAAVVDQFSGAGEDDLSPEWITYCLAEASNRIHCNGGGGATAAGALLVDRNGQPYWLAFNIGDSRVYLAANGQDVRRVSVDHSVVQEMVDDGRLTPDQARSHPDRHIVTRAVGTNEDPRPDFWLLPRGPGDRLLLCSDGVTSELDDGAIAEVLCQPNSAQDVAEQLIARALLAGGRDNITCVVVDMQPALGQPGEPAADHDDTRPRLSAATG